MHIVLTGPATTRDGKQVLRGNLIALAESKGYTVQRAVTARTELLVASRADTVKARKAHDAGISVTTYGAFIELLGGVVPEAGAKADPFTDSMTLPAIEVEYAADGVDYI